MVIKVCQELPAYPCDLVTPHVVTLKSWTGTSHLIGKQLSQ